MTKEAWRNSSQHKVANAIKKVLNGSIELENPELVLELLINVQRKLDMRGYSPTDRYYPSTK